MHVTIDITPELAAQLREAAANEGLEANAYIVQTLAEHMRQTQPYEVPCLNETETRLLEQINVGLPQEAWQRYHDLLAKRRAERLTPEEHTALMALSDQIEELNVRRIESLVALARLRHTSLEALMQQLGVQTPPYV
jgi:hypothetical protein